MKTSNLLALVLSFALSTGGFAAIDYLFTHSASWQEQRSADLMVHASRHASPLPPVRRPGITHPAAAAREIV
jgi:hypothetical protein